MTTNPCADVLDGYDITCDLPEGHDGNHAGGDRTYWGPAQPGNGPVVQICHPDQVAAASKAFGLPVVSDDGYNHSPQCHWCNGTANRDTCPRSIALAEYVRRFRGGAA